MKAADRRRRMIVFPKPDYVEFLEKQGFSHYGTFTFAGLRSQHSAWSSFREGVDHIEKVGKLHVPWFAVQEQLLSKFSGLGYSPIPIHFHSLLTLSHGTLAVELERFWRAKHGDPLCVPLTPDGGAIGYCLKLVTQDCCEYDLSQTPKSYARQLERLRQYM